MHPLAGGDQELVVWVIGRRSDDGGAGERLQHRPRIAWRQTGATAAAVAVQECVPGLVGQQARRPEPGGSGEVGRGIADAEVVDVDQGAGVATQLA